MLAGNYTKYTEVSNEAILADLMGFANESGLLTTVSKCEFHGNGTTYWWVLVDQIIYSLVIIRF